MKYHLFFSPSSSSWRIMNGSRILSIKQSLRLFIIMCRRFGLPEINSVSEPEREIYCLFSRLLNLSPTTQLYITSIDFDSNFHTMIHFDSPINVD